MNIIFINRNIEFTTFPSENIDEKSINTEFTLIENLIHNREENSCL